MDMTSLLERFRSKAAYSRPRPFYRRHCLSPQDYLAKQRVLLIRDLPEDHRLRQRAQEKSGDLLPPDSSPPNLPRKAFSDEEIKDIKHRRRAPSGTGSDPDDASHQLRNSQLSNAEDSFDYDQTCEEQNARSREKRKRAVSPEERKAIRLKLSDFGLNEDNIAVADEELDLEDGEIEDDLEIVQSLEEENYQLKSQNEAMRAVLEPLMRRRSSTPEQDLPLSPPASPPETDDSENEEGLQTEDDGSDESVKSVESDMEVEGGDDLDLDILDDIKNKPTQSTELNPNAAVFVTRMAESLMSGGEPGMSAGENIGKDLDESRGSPEVQY